MIRVAFRSLFARKVRLLLSALAIVVGVGGVAGSLVLTDTLRAAFLDLFSSISEGVSVSVRGATDVGTFESGAPVPESLLGEIRTVDGVAEAVGTVSGYAAVVGRDGEIVGGGGPPTLGVEWTTSEVMNPLTVEDGREPRGPGEVVVDRVTAERGDLVVGEPVSVVLRSGVQDFTLVGTVVFGSSGNLAGATLAVFEPETAQQIVGTPGEFETIDIAAAPGVSDEQLAERVTAILPDGYEALTREQVAEEGAEAISEGLGFFTIALLVFAGIALFVGAFLINNTFAILVGQRTQELALMRSLGAGRSQVIRIVLLEAAAVGLVASAVGLGMGVLLALGLESLLQTIGIELPSIGLRVLPTTVIWSFVVGVGVALIAALGPARRASKVAPIEALRQAQTPPRAAWGRRTIIGLVVFIVGSALVIYGLGGGPFALTGVGAIAGFLGLAILSPILVKPVGIVLGAPAAAMSTAGLLGRDNTVRNPGRTATTASALMIGLAFVTAAGIFGASVRASVAESLDSSLGADFVLTSSSFQGFSPALGEAVAEQPEVAYTSAVRLVEARADGPAGDPSAEPSGVFVSGVDPATIGVAAGLSAEEGDLANLGGDTIALDQGTAEAWGVGVGDRLAMSFTTIERVPLRVVALYEENVLVGEYAVALGTFDEFVPQSLDQILFVGVASDADAEAVRVALDDLAVAYPDVEVQDRTELIASQQSQIDQLINVIYVLLALAVLIALLGIINTLALSVLERTSEIGVLRAIGMSRRQIRSMIFVESIIIAVFGALLGLAAGTGIGYVLIRSLEDEGLGTFALPIGALLVFLAVAVVLGALAAIGPAWRASRVRIVDAIATE